MSVTTHETTYAEPPNGANRRRFIKIAIVVVGLAAIAVAFLIWNGNNDPAAPSTHVRTVPKNSLPVGEASADLSLSTKVVGGEPRGFPHTEAGAVEAAAAAHVGTARLLNHSANDNEAFIADAFSSAPDLSSQIAHQKAEKHIDSSGQMVHPLEGDHYYNETLYQYGAYRLDAVTTDTATVTVWSPRLYGPGNPDAVDKLLIQWGQSTFKMQWIRGDWRVTNGYGTDDETPPLPANIDRVDVSFKERRTLLGKKWNLYQGATEKWPVDLLGPEPQGTPR